MHYITSVEDEIDRVLHRFTSFEEHTEERLKNLISLIENLEKKIKDPYIPSQSQLTEVQALIINQGIDKIKEVTTKLVTDHRDFHAFVSKVGKAIDKHFISDLQFIENRNFLQDDESKKILNQIIAEHFLRKGMLDVAEKLMEEANITIPEEKRTPLSELNVILDALRKRNLVPALEWAKKNKDKLDKQSSCLEFKLHKLQFIEYLAEGATKQNELIEYARNHLQSLATRHVKEIQTLMGSLLYLKIGIASSPYRHLLDSTDWNEIPDIFAREACTLLGMSVESPLTVSFEAGCIALPVLTSIRRAMQQRKVTSVWNLKEELPIVINLGPNYQFHSIFACPILREQSSESNPPVRLVCGHVISRDALNKLAGGNSKLKCPYCPFEQNLHDARQIYF